MENNQKSPNFGDFLTPWPLLMGQRLIITRLETCQFLVKPSCNEGYYSLTFNCQVDLTLLFIFDRRSQRVDWDFVASIINIEF